MIKTLKIRKGVLLVLQKMSAEIMRYGGVSERKPYVDETNNNN